MVRWMAWRFMLRGTERGRFSALTMFAWVAIGLGTGAMTSLISVMYGFESSLKSRVLATQPHIIVKGPNQGAIPQPDKLTQAIASLTGVVRAVPFVETEMIVTVGAKRLGAVVWGLPRSEFERFSSGLKTGSLPDFDSRELEMLVAVELAHRLGAVPGSDVHLVSPLSVAGALGAVPSQGTFRVSGIYASGHYEFDQQHLFVFLEDAQDLLRLKDAIHGWHLRVERVEDAREIAIRVRSVLGAEFDVQSWEEFNSALFQSLKLEQLAMLSILSLAVLIAVLNVAITLAMHVTYKRKNIGVLRALGASNKTIRSIFVWQGAWLGMVGMGIGVVLTALFFVHVKFVSAYQLPDIYYDRSLPIELRALPTILIFFGAALLVLLATLLPARAAARMDPVEAIRE